jgi:hypothetical protein
LKFQEDYLLTHILSLLISKKSPKANKPIGCHPGNEFIAKGITSGAMVDERACF